MSLVLSRPDPPPRSRCHNNPRQPNPCGCPRTKAFSGHAASFLPAKRSKHHNALRPFPNYICRTLRTPGFRFAALLVGSSEATMVTVAVTGAVKEARSAAG